jgi:alpha-N-arabinofuranosidase
MLCLGSLSFIDSSAAAAEVAAAANSPNHALIRVDANRVENQLSPMLYGQFLEYMFQCIKGGLHGEMIRNRSFEEPADVVGLSRDWEPYPDRRNHDGALDFSWDAANSYPERQSSEKETREHSLFVNANPGIITRHGVCQGNIPVRKDAEYQGYLWLKTSGYEGQITVALEPEVEGGAPFAEAVIKPIRGDWSQYAFRLRSRASDPLARFAILFSGRGRVWIDQVSLLPSEAVDGVRKDVEQRVRDLKPGFIRWPGGNVAQDYHWLWGVGPRDQRVTWTNLSWRNEPEPSDFGTDEYIRFCRRIGAEPTIVVNIDGRGATAEEAANWVEYCNGPASSKFGKMRAVNGQQEPFGVRYWELGNEIWGSWVRGHSDAATYAANAVRYAAAMRAQDPSIKLIGCGDNDMKWNETVLRKAGPSFDFLAIHHYYGSMEMAGDPANLMARPLHFESFYGKVRSMIRELVPDRPIMLAINEWGLAMPVEQAYSMDAALYAARLMNVFERGGDRVAMTSVSDLVNGWPGGIIQASRHGVFVTSTYLVNKLYSETLGTDRLAAEVESPVFDSSREGRGIPFLDAVASRSADGRQIFIKAVNTDRKQPLAVAVQLKGAALASKATVRTLQGDGPSAFNHFATPNAVSVQSREIDAGESFTLELPPGTVSVLVLSVQGR